MSDIATLIIPGPPGQLPTYDFGIDGYQLAEDDGLQTAVIISLFSDARANNDDILPDPSSDDLRGYWGDSYADIEGDVLGSKLWLLSREKQMQSVADRYADYARTALEWMVRDGVAGSVDASATFPRREWIALTVAILRPGKAPVQYQFLTFWGGQ